MSRPIKLDDTIHRAIVKAVELGLTRVDAAAIAGITDRTIRNWVDRGSAEDSEEPFRSFSIDLRRAEANVKASMISTIIQAGKQGNWKAAAFYLERRDPHWRPNQRIEQDVVTSSGEISPQQIRDTVRKRFGGNVAPEIGDENDRSSDNSDC